ncbi:MAG TPA: hypothetical protein VFS26_04375, partial [Solirubrobacterales bacterium]|nr:hypothetical protein [Solirubrobacterales bacterium]
EALASYARAGAEEDLGRLGELMGFVRPLALVLAGRGEEAREGLEPLLHVADAIGAGPTEVAVRALRAELDGDVRDLPAPTGPSIAGALVLRARARAGDEGAAVQLREWCEAMGIPGLLAGLT